MSLIAVDEPKKGSRVAVKEEPASTTVSDGKDTQVAKGSNTQVVVERDSGTQIVCKGDGEYLKGDRGDAATIRVGNTKSGDVAEVIARGTTNDVILDFILPKGDKGDPGAKGDTGEPGPQGEGLQGIKGDNGNSLYTWVKYAPTNDTNLNDMQDDPVGMDWIGVSYNNVRPENEDSSSNTKSNYSWSKIQGTDGQDGNDGNTGPEGPQGPAGTSLVYIGEWGGDPNDPSKNHPDDDDLPLYEGGPEAPIEDGYWYFNTNSSDENRNGKTYVYYGSGWFRMTESGGEGPAGPQGAPGGGVQWKGEFRNGERPNGAQLNWCYKDIDDDKYFIYDGYDWATLTSDGNTTPDGVPGGNGVYVFVTFHDSVSKPSKPITNGNDPDGDGWFTDPNLPYTRDDQGNFVKSKITWISQKHGTDENDGNWTDPIAITTTIRGPVGHRGSESIMVAVENYYGWDDQIAGQACSGGSPTEWDIVTIYDVNDPAQQSTKRWAHNSEINDWEWLDYSYVFLGDVLVDGTLDGQALKARTTVIAGSESDGNVAGLNGLLDGTEEDEDGNIAHIRIWAGSSESDKESAPFRVAQNGEVVSESLEVTGGSLSASSIEGTEIIGGSFSTSAPPAEGEEKPEDGWPVRAEMTGDGDKFAIYDKDNNKTFYVDEDGSVVMTSGIIQGGALDDSVKNSNIVVWLGESGGFSGSDYNVGSDSPDVYLNQETNEFIIRNDYYIRPDSELEIRFTWPEVKLSEAYNKQCSSSSYPAHPAIPSSYAKSNIKDGDEPIIQLVDKNFDVKGTVHTENTWRVDYWQRRGSDCSLVKRNRYSYTTIYNGWRYTGLIEHGLTGEERVNLKGWRIRITEPGVWTDQTNNSRKRPSPLSLFQEPRGERNLPWSSLLIWEGTPNYRVDVRDTDLYDAEAGEHVENYQGSYLMETSSNPELGTGVVQGHIRLTQEFLDDSKLRSVGGTTNQSTAYSYTKRGVNSEYPEGYFQVSGQQVIRIYRISGGEYV